MNNKMGYRFASNQIFCSTVQQGKLQKVWLFIYFCRFPDLWHFEEFSMVLVESRQKFICSSRTLLRRHSSRLAHRSSAMVLVESRQKFICSSRTLLRRHSSRLAHRSSAMVLVESRQKFICSSRTLLRRHSSRLAHIGVHHGASGVQAEVHLQLPHPPQATLLQVSSHRSSAWC